MILTGYRDAPRRFWGRGTWNRPIPRGEKIKPKGILLIDSLIELPFEDRRLVGAYASRMAAEVEAYEPRRPRQMRSGCLSTR